MTREIGHPPLFLILLREANSGTLNMLARRFDSEDAMKGLAPAEFSVHYETAPMEDR